MSVAVCPSAEAAALRERLRGVRHTVLVLSGKGGVGKSTFSALLASGLAADEAKQVRAGRAAEGPGAARLRAVTALVASPPRAGFAAAWSARQRFHRTAWPSLTALAGAFPDGGGWFVSQVALLDIDICGPSIPKMMGLEGEQVSENSNVFKGFLALTLQGCVDLKLLKAQLIGKCVWQQVGRQR